MTQRLFLLSPDTVFAARVNQASFTYPLSSVTFDTVTTGAYTAVKPGMTVLFGSTAGDDDLGRQRIRKAATSSVIYFGRSSKGDKDGEVNLTDNAYITVLDDFRVWAKITNIDDNGDITKDEETWTDQTNKIPPKANITGGWRIATIDSGTSVATFQFVGTGSYAVASGATISTYLWDVDDGTITVGTSASNTITATFPAGQRWVSLTVTDSNSKTHTMRVLVIASPLTHTDCVAFQCTEHRITQEGQSCSFRILEDIPESTYPDGTAVIFWEDEPASASDYSNVKFWGWHQTDQNEVRAGREATLRDVVLNCLDMPGRLNTLPGFPQSVERHTGGGSWLKMAGLNMDLYLDYLFRWHSTALENAYYTDSGTADDYAMVVIGSDGASLWAQAQARAKALVPDYVITCDRNGHLRVIVDPFLQDTADRTATSQVTIDANDYLSVGWEHTRPPRTHWIWGEAIRASATFISALFCTAPGQTPGQGETEQTSGEQLAIDQDGLNSCEGHRYARINSDTGLVPFLLPDDSDSIEPADMTWVTLDVSGDPAARRGLGFSSARGLPIEINITYDYGRTGTVKSVEVLWEKETSGQPAVTYLPPEPDWEPPWEPPPNPFPEPTPTGGGDGLGTVYVMYQLNLIRTRAFSAASPAYTAIKTTAVDSFYDWILDPFDPSHNGFLLTSDGVYRSQDLDQSSPSFSQVLSLSDMETALSVSGTLSNFFKIEGCIKQQDFFIFGVWDVDVGSPYGKVHVFVTTDGGDNWSNYTAYSTTSGNVGGKSIYHGAIAVSQSELGSGGDPIIGIICGHDELQRFLLSEDGGQTWNEQSSGWSLGPSSNSEFSALHFPYNNNSDSTKIISSAWSDGAINYTYSISTDQGVNWSPITASGLSTIDARFNRQPIETWTADRQEMYAFGNASGVGERGGFYRSSDFGASWTKISDLPANANAAGGFPYNGNQFYVLADVYILLSIDGGVTWIDKTGDWTGDQDTVANCGGVIVPLWTEE